MRQINLTPFHAKYFAHNLTRRATDGIDRLSMSLFDAAVDLNPHQIEAAMFALRSPLSNGVILADEVGLGKTIEAGIVLCQLWAERKRRLLVICPASLRKQWALELLEKFNLDARVLDSREYKAIKKSGRQLSDSKKLLVMSFNFANAIRDELKATDWDIVVIDEAHKLRNAYRESNKIGQGIRWATEGCRKVLLTATPLQNSLLELYGLSTLIDEKLFGDIDSFRSQYASAGSNLDALRQRLSTFSKRTLRKQVTEYIRYTERKPITIPFRPTDNEHAIYEAVSSFLQREDSYALPRRQRHLTALILRKLLASSSIAIASTLDKLALRLEKLRDTAVDDGSLLTIDLIEDEEIDGDLLDEIIDDELETNDEPRVDIDKQKIEEEIDILNGLSSSARKIGIDTKSRSLLKALNIGFDKMNEIGAAPKAVIFTESRRTQEYLKKFLEMNDYAGRIVLFNGSNTDTESKAIYEAWRAENEKLGRSSGSRAIDVRTALIEHFRDDAAIFIATEAAAEGVNLQFCSLVINYDLPWNPQRIEQRIGRCHRYGQKHDVVVINFMNERNAADQRVLELLSEKFRLFDGVFGSSDDVLGTIESGVDFEKRILAIYQECRTTEEIDTAFSALQAEMEEQIRTKLEDTRKALFEHFDEDVHERLKFQLETTRDHLDKVGKRFWDLSTFILNGKAIFIEDDLTFDLHESPNPAIPLGRYHLISKSGPSSISEGDALSNHLYRLSHPLGQFVLENAKGLDTPIQEVAFDITNNPTKISVVENLKGRSGFLTLNQLTVKSYEEEEYLLFSGFDDDGNSIDQETMDKLFSCGGSIVGDTETPGVSENRLVADSEQHAKATISKSLEQNNKYFFEAREKLEKWAEDMVVSAEKALRDTKERIKELRRQAKQAVTLEEQHQILEKTRELERRQRKQRQEIFDVEDEIMDKRDSLIDQLEKRLAQEVHHERIFSLRWRVI